MGKGAPDGCPRTAAATFTPRSRPPDGRARACGSVDRAEGGRQGLEGTGNATAAKAVGRAIAERAKAAGVESVAFDRSGFRYHGRVKALAEAAREAGLKF